MSLPVLLCPITVACKTVDNVVASDQRSSAANEPLIPAAGKPSAAALPELPSQGDCPVLQMVCITHWCRRVRLNWPS